jgi:serine/threonine-protein kinase RsbW
VFARLDQSFGWTGKRRTTVLQTSAETLAGRASWAVEGIRGRSRVRPHKTDPPESTREAPPDGAIPRDLAGSFEVSLPSVPDAPAAARLAVSAWMAGHVSETMLADAQLLVVELVTNSVRHAEAPADAVISIRARASVDGVRLEVEDGGRTGSVARRAPDLQNGGGFGLNVVERLSARWGVNRDAGTRVWADLAFPAAA